MTKDLVCGMEFDKDFDKEKTSKLKHEGKTYYFCSPSCQWAFKENPDQFLKGNSKMDI